MMKTYGKLNPDGSVEAVSLELAEDEPLPEGIVPLVKVPAPEETETNKPEPYLALADDSQSVERRWRMVAKSTEDRRQSTRDTLRARFLLESDSFLGPFYALFQSLTPLLDAGRDAAAELAIRSAVAPAWYDDTERAAFELKRDEYADAVHDLPKLS